MSEGRVRARRLATVPSRSRILEAAIELFARYGFDGMSLQLLADHVGLHKSTLYHHFDTKGQLAREALESLVPGVLGRLEPLAADEPPSLERFVEVVVSIDDYLAERSWAALFLLRTFVGPAEEFYHVDFEGFGDPVGRIFRGVAEWLDRARRAGVIRPVHVQATVLNLMGLALFPLALADSARDEPPFAGARSETSRRRHREEYAETIRRALQP